MSKEFDVMVVVNAIDVGRELVSQMLQACAGSGFVEGVMLVGSCNDEAAAGPKSPANVAQHPNGVRDMLNHVTEDDEVQGFVSEGTEPFAVQIHDVIDLDQIRFTQFRKALARLGRRLRIRIDNGGSVRQPGWLMQRAYLKSTPRQQAAGKKSMLLHPISPAPAVSRSGGADP